MMTETQRKAMRLLSAMQPINASKLHVMTLAAFTARQWVKLDMSGMVTLTPFGKQAYHIEAKRDYDHWKSALRKASKTRRQAREADLKKHPRASKRK